MTWTYSDPSTYDRDKVRLLIGDTNTSDQQLSDEEIAFFLTEEGSVYRAAAAAARSLMAKYSRLVDKSVGDLSLSYSQRVTHYESLIRDLDRRSAGRTSVPYFGGGTKSGMDAEKEDTDRPKPSFERGQFDFPGTGSNSSTSTDDQE